ncbi:uncharacterized protein BDW43DRAFT_299575 [Aspergillus alliaceus]|uniref:uncharacterized protein n=1 Tax=Petromyces alliaceus TaxID=209559 RepID=UPI0012A605F1|nr:uncharacterized protein BDW43DRAFT_299575 [Aspergillus alliaceus]KAB8234524.1 hypothetical protein BDW43DRAFT_299575 [Aspergillus alliaceus]
MVALTGDRKSVLEGTWALGAIAIVIMGLRVFAKGRLHHFGPDDLVMFTALVFALAASIFFTIAVLDYGFGAGLPESDDVNALKFYTLMEVCGVVGTCLGRVAFILYLLPILSTRKLFRNSLWALLALQIVANSVMVILILAQCRDIRGVWDPEYATNCMEDYIQLRYGYFICACNTSADLLLAILPSFIFWDLKLRPIIKFSLMALTSLGLV